MLSVCCTRYLTCHILQCTTYLTGEWISSSGDLYVHFYGTDAIWTRLDNADSTQFVAEPLPPYVAEILRQKEECEEKMADFELISASGTEVC